jgi:hypothetical protein
MNINISTSLSKIVVSPEGEELYTFEYAALVTGTSIPLVEAYISLGVIEPIGSMLYSHAITRISQIQRLREDLGLTLIAAAMVLDMAQEMSQLRARLKVYQSYRSDAL